MAHFAKINSDNIVTQVIVIEQQVLNLGHWGNPADWIQTSYNTHGGVHYGPDGKPDGGVALRKNFAGVGMKYDPVRDAFIGNSPCASWILNEDTCLWEPPVPRPNDGKTYFWDEDSQNWISI